MFDYKTVVSDVELTTKFMQALDDPNVFVGVDKETDASIGSITIDPEGCTFEGSTDEVFMQYKLWQTRPERKVGKPAILAEKRMDELVEQYEEILVGAYILNRPNEKIEVGKTQGYHMMLDWLRSTDFYTSPASTQYHGSYPGGLLIHSLQVYNEALELLKLPQFKDIEPAAAAIATLTHDWCKINSYESYTRNVKNEQTGQWEKVPAYKKNFKGLPLGHGATSMFLASRFFNLSADVALAIRWHMGHWNVADGETNEFQIANENYPLVHLIQFADQLSITEYEAIRTGVRA